MLIPGDHEYQLFAGDFGDDRALGIKHDKKNMPKVHNNGKNMHNV